MLKLNHIAFHTGTRFLDLSWTSENGGSVIALVTPHGLPKIVHKDNLIGGDHRGQFAYDIWKLLDDSRSGYPELVAVFVAKMQQYRNEGYAFANIESEWDEIYRIMCAIDELVQKNR